MDEKSNIVKFNCGGKKILTTKDTLMCGGKNSYFSTIINQKFRLDLIDGYIFIDRNPKYFEMVIDYLRSNKIPKQENIDLNFFNSELDYFGLNLPKLKNIYIYIESNIYGAILTFSGLSKEESEKLTDEMRNEGNTYPHWMKVKGRSFLESKGWKFESVVEDLGSQRYSYTFSQIVQENKKEKDEKKEQIIIKLQ